MTPRLALLVCSGFIVWLFVTENKRRKVSSALWLPVIWGFIIGSKPISLWFVNGGSAGATDNYVEGSPFDRLFFMSLIGAAWVVLVRRQVNCSLFFQSNRWLCVYFFYLAVSAV